MNEPYGKNIINLINIDKHKVIKYAHVKGEKIIDKSECSCSDE